MSNRIIVVSQNLLKYDIDIPLDAVLRINLAWHKDLNSVRELLEEYEAYNIFLDVIDCDNILKKRLVGLIVV